VRVVSRWRRRVGRELRSEGRRRRRTSSGGDVRRVGGDGSDGSGGRWSRENRRDCGDVGGCRGVLSADGRESGSWVWRRREGSSETSSRSRLKGGEEVSQSNDRVARGYSICSK